jgi:hypothetical protein
LGFAPAIVGLAAQVLDLAGDHAQAASLLSRVTEEPLCSALKIDRLSAQARHGQTERAHALAVQVADEIVATPEPGTQVIAASRLTPVLLQMGERELAKKVALQTGATLKAELDDLGENESIKALSAAASSLGGLGLLSQAQSFYARAFDGARPLGRAEVCSIVATSADWIDPDQARGTIRALEEIDSWWKATPYV